jgi:hypothetical protein
LFTTKWHVSSLAHHVLRPTGESGQGDLLTCRVDTGRCTLEIDETTWLESVPPLIPGDGAVGAEYALGHAMRES